jgi:alkyl hydroperoxide reductase subunit AhpC
VEVREHYEDIADYNAEVLVISFALAEALEGYRSYLKLPFFIASDPERRAYRDYGMLKGSTWQVWHPRLLWKYVVLISSGMKLQRPAKGEDISQLGGDFIIDGAGKVRFAHISHGPGDRPAVSELIGALARLE